ncbi:MAG: ornithine cyclodeaminase family protein [Armatimonadota bacterium]|nr:ornithine cyclodeaminase family protein [Armatimonadota bacterium]MDR7451166.1 ornithine cyclodeaminase family protein [Armatimonadota bacterium]MDR7467229.1 ornithine cyclodeaminase family protein [Armatimonadota bacterium]MDR7494843.1 ornithine cyclodeaminase family protein [Armatimonadota bacterium]MDR7500264.1 ornithine cyclodeaminase family protein [Armatimonadota bacterium]
MALYLTESDVTRLLRIDDVIAVVEDAFRRQGRGEVVNRPRQRIQTGRSTLHVMAAGLPALGVMGFKAYTSVPGGARFLAYLYSAESGELLAVIEADRLGQMRTGAASAVATKYMARPEAGTVGIIGTGWQTRSQVLAVSRVRPVALVKCYSRSPARREAFAAEMIQELGAEVVAEASGREAVEGTEIVITVTNAREPVLLGAWLEPGMHVNAVGSNAASRRELDTEAVGRAAVCAVDDLVQARVECGDLIDAVGAGATTWETVVELGRIVTGEVRGRAAADDITLFESQGVALEDVAAMKLVYDLAREHGAGITIWS